MKTLLLDSSVYVASLNSKDIFYKQTKKFNLKLQDQSVEVEVITPTLIILEIANVFKKPFEYLLPIFRANLIVELDLDLVREIIPIFKEVNLKTSDAIIVAIAKIYKAELISWDKRLIRESRKLVKAYTPKEYLERQIP